jgi:SulP family sulfate permease
MPTLAAVLIWAAIGSLRLEQAYWIFRTGYVSQIALVTTFLATLFLSVTAAVGIGVVLSLLLQLNREALDLKVVELVRAGGGLEERPAPAALPSRAVTVLDVYGSLFHAGARTLQVRLPDPVAADRPVVVLRLRGRTALGATAFAVLTAYAERLAQRGGRLYLSGVDPGLTAQMRRAGRLAAGEALHVYEAEPRLGVSSLRAVEDAEGWLAAQTA